VFSDVISAKADIRKATFIGTQKLDDTKRILIMYLALIPGVYQ
jgi:hypothetical protein